ncbi:acyl-CoA synthetase (AMP-forming)/AMP-acid ligase II [Halopolyspora algeriensis]|uniref:Acyl-CoA synthetase (AMP-forming)/AMP-acid ligase II n=1 Tax=Halopolyspora algeriensis TaxID=1500506 RepID=A0A368VUY6_9ACTN|nr:AMP-binding protein [Halopolyspora algeriensis]RCW45705.1 acyl-CoA synthetase (AMP-forming)/AMP-acid ligase II [Halopolyspora algeriensis]TQM54089.1 acyl-CoA synthetase (AMP-forming)/AMP-acid ligase II [Halopolyspora algeriensis]
MTTYDPAAYREFFEREFTYLAGFRRNTHRYADRVAMHCPVTDTSWTYAELGTRVDRLAVGLTEAGVRPGDVVVYQLYNTPEFAQLYLATQACGAVGAPINFRLSPGETAFILDDSRPRVFVYDTALAETASEALERAEHRPDLVVAVGGGEAPSRPDGGPVARFDELFASEGPPPTVSGTVYEETTRLYTSGTTGMPKGVPLNSVIEIFTAHDVIMHFLLTPEDRTLNMTPWFHRGGLYAGGPNPAFYLGAQIVPMRAFDPELCLDYVERFGITFLIGAPTNLAMLANVQSARPRDLSGLRGIVTMGAPLEREAALRYQEILCPRIFNGYGTTEAFWNSFLRPADLPEHAGSAGRACTDDDIAVVKVFDDRLASPHETVAKDDAEVGEVIVRSPKCGYAYANAPEQEAAKFHKGWLYIGDLATWDSEEFVTIVGRKDDMIVSGGENIHPVQVEEALNEHPGIDDSMVVGIPHEQWGQLVVAYVVPAEDALTPDDCDRHCRGHPMLAAYKRPRGYRLVDALPVTATGKKVHYKARQQAASDYAQGLFTGTEPAGTSETPRTKGATR